MEQQTQQYSNSHSHSQSDSHLQSHPHTDSTIYTEDIKTTISCPTSICDLNGQVLPNGNYYFTINKYDDRCCQGTLAAKGQYGDFTFKTIDIVKMMSIAQSRLARRSGLCEKGMPDYVSPPISPENSNLTREINEKEVVHNYFYTPDKCSICLNMISDNRKRLACNHSFHSLCISQWLARDQRCPICRSIHVENTSTNRSRRRSSMFTSHSTSAPTLHNVDIIRNRARTRTSTRGSDTYRTSLHLRHRYNNYVIPTDNYVDPNAYDRQVDSVNTTEYRFKK